MKRPLLIPATGWNTQSVVTGYIKVRAFELLAPCMEAIHAFATPYDWPLSNTFWSSSEQQHRHPVVGFAASYKQIEEYWGEWLSPFVELLSLLDAVDAHVHLDCIAGSFSWKLKPRSRVDAPFSRGSTLGEAWGIVEASEPDITTDADWLAYFPAARLEGIARWSATSKRPHEG